MKKPLVIHPFLFGIFPILFLFSHNVTRMSPGEIVMPAIVVTCFAFLLWLLLVSLVKDKEKAGIIVSMFALLFFSYGRFLNAIEGLTVGGIVVGTYSYVLLVWGIVFISVVYPITKTRRNLHRLTTLMNMAAALLVATPMITIGVHRLLSRDYTITQEQITAVNLGKSNKRPDIYYIILDGYARADVLQEFYQYDNSEFLDHLTQKGFYIGNRSTANYAQSGLSLASSLNLVYLDDLVNRIGAESDNRMPLRNMIKNSRVAEFLKQHGYVIVAFSSGISGTEIRNADVYMAPRWSLSEFQNVLINTTPIPILLDMLPMKSRWQYALHRERLLYIFDHLAGMGEMNSPVFVFAHIVAPHPPFVFGEHGQEIEPNSEFSLGDGSQIMDRDEYVEAYKSQLIFVSKTIEATIDEILANSHDPPIIILQSDHGPGSMTHWGDFDKTNFKERMSILNAYYLPNNGRTQLYDEITPVNTFRVIFNQYFGTSSELLDDDSYFSSWSHPYELINVTERTNVD